MIFAELDDTIFGFKVFINPLKILFIQLFYLFILNLINYQISDPFEFIINSNMCTAGFIGKI